MLIKHIVLKMTAIAVALAICVSPALQPAALAAQTEKHWAQSAIDRFAAIGLVSSSTDFDPDDYITRADACVILDRMVGFDIKAKNRFSDLPSGEYYTDSMLALAATGLLYIPPGDEIYPESFISRELAISMLYRLFQLDNSWHNPDWTDLETITYYEAVTTFASGGYIPYAMIKNGEFRPSIGITRGEFVAILSNFISLFADLEKAGSTPITGNILCKSLPSSTITTGKIFLTEGIAQSDENVIYLKGWDADNPEGLNYSNQLSSFTTNFDTGSWSRSNNIRIAAEDYISGTVLAPGETFSFNSVVGPRTSAKGYGMATIFAGTGQGIGGGICQVSSTLFNAALLSNMAITERHQHSMRVGYVELGRDATIYLSILDLKFTNPLDVPIKILMDVDTGTGSCTASIWTAAPVTIPEVSITTEHNGVSHSVYRYADGELNYSANSRY